MSDAAKTTAAPAADGAWYAVGDLSTPTRNDVDNDVYVKRGDMIFRLYSLLVSSWSSAGGESRVQSFACLLQ